MSKSGESGYMVAGCIGLILLIAFAALIGWLLYRASPYLMTGAAIYGAGIALRNYGLAFANNVRPGKATP
jgi:hypothetical protein